MQVLVARCRTGTASMDRDATDRRSVAAVQQAMADSHDEDEDVDMPSPRGATWSYAEHARFMQALEIYGAETTGDEWNKITVFVQTRAIEEVRLHGRQYLQRLMHLRQLQPGGQLPPSRQTQGQDPQQSSYQSRQRLLQLSRMSHTLMVNGIDPTQYPFAATNNQNEPQNQQFGVSSSQKVKTEPPSTTVSKSSSFNTTNSSLSVVAMSVATAMNTLSARRTVDAFANPSTVTSTRKAKVWTFQEDKVLETALASWQRGKPYSWPKIATTLPGKTAKDVRLRYNQLVEDIASIDMGGTFKHGYAPPPAVAPLPPALQSQPPPFAKPPKVPTVDTTAVAVTRQSGLSSRIAPPPPIQVPPPLSAKSHKSASGSGSGVAESPIIFPTSARGRATTPSFMGTNGMLSPTFLDFLASEDKQPLAFSSGIDLPSPLLPSPLVGRNGRSTSTDYLGPLPSPLRLDLMTPTSTRSHKGGGVTSKESSRIWQDASSGEPKSKVLDASQAGTVASESGRDGSDSAR